jgi:uncharacterized membrane protein YfcA
VNALSLAFAGFHHVASPIPTAQLLFLGITLLAAGGLTGFLAGLFGIGGGTIIVPVLYEVFGLFSVADEVRMQLCIGTSLAIIVPTSISAFAIHWRQGMADANVLKAWIAPIVLGVLIGIASARYAAPAAFKLAFVAIALLTAARILWGSLLPNLSSELPHGARMAGYGVAIGASSSLVGIGGGLVANMVMTLHGRPLQQAIATSSGIGIIVAIPGALGYVLAGWGRSGLPPLSFGFVSLVGLLLLVPTSLVTAKAGAAAAHKIPKQLLAYLFAAYLILVSARFILSVMSV